MIVRLYMIIYQSSTLHSLGRLPHVVNDNGGVVNVGDVGVSVLVHLQWHWTVSTSLLKGVVERWMMLWGDRGCCGEMDDVVGR